MMSMTGFGRGQARGELLGVAVEVRSVNHRFAECVIRLPRGYGGLEERIRALAADQLLRGRIEIAISLEDSGLGRRTVKLDRGLLASYAAALAEAKAALSLSGDVDVRTLVQLPELFAIDEGEGDLERSWPVVRAALDEALAAVLAMRRREGVHLQQAILERLDRFAGLVDDIAARSDELLAAYRSRLTRRVRELDAAGMADPDRVAMEVALLAERSAIDEELVRLQSHVTGFRAALAEGAPIGRKLDFLLQEMGREVNTIVAKAPGAGIAALVVESKHELEKIREQVQNLA